MYNVTQTPPTTVATENNSAFFDAFRDGAQKQQEETQKTAENLMSALQAAQAALAAAAEQSKAQAARIAFLERAQAETAALQSQERKTNQALLALKEQQNLALQEKINDQDKRMQYLAKSHELLTKVVKPTEELLNNRFPLWDTSEQSRYMAKIFTIGTPEILPAIKHLNNHGS